MGLIEELKKMSRGFRNSVMKVNYGKFNKNDHNVQAGRKEQGEGNA